MTKPELPKPRYQLLARPEAEQDRPAYCGLARLSPAHLVADEVRREVWEPSLREQEDDGSASGGEWVHYLPTLEAARRLWSLYAARGYVFDCVAVYPCEDAEDAAYVAGLAGYRGLDVANSELESVLEPARVWTDMPADDEPVNTVPLWRMLSRFCRRAINRWGLLEDFGDAVAVRDAVHALVALEQDFPYFVGVRLLAVVDMEMRHALDA